jgi:hypothetical protein
MELYEDAARQREEMARAVRQSNNEIVQDIVDRFGVTPARANYLLDLERRNRGLESGDRSSHSGLRP